MTMTQTEAPKKTPGTPRTLKGLANRFVEELDAGRQHYAEADRILSRILEKAGVGTVIALGGGFEAEVVDNFVDREGRPRNKAWKPAGINRFELKVRKTKAG